MVTKVLKASRTASAAWQNYWIASAPANGFYIGGNPSPTTGNALLARADANGGVLWNKKLALSGGDSAASRGFVSNGDSVAILLSYTDGRTGVALYNASGVQQWQKTLSHVIAYSSFGGRARWMDSAANVYLGGADTISFNNYALTKLSASDGSVLWSVETRGTLGNQSGPGPMGQLSGGDLVFMNARDPTNSRSWIQRRSSADGSVVWTTELSWTGNTNAESTVAVDAADNIYVVGRTFGSPNSLPITKLDASGAQVWSRLIRTAGGGFQWDGRAIAVTSGLLIPGFLSGDGGTSHHYYVPSDGAIGVATARKHRFFLLSDTTSPRIADKAGDTAWYVAPDGGSPVPTFTAVIKTDDAGASDDGTYGPYTRATQTCEIVSHSPTISSVAFTPRSFTAPTVTAATITETAGDLVITPYYLPALEVTGIASTVSFSDDVGVLGAQYPNPSSTVFGPTGSYAIAYGDAAGIASTTALGTPTFTRNTSRAASSLAPTAAFGLSFSSRGTSGRPAGQVSGLASATIFGAHTAATANNRTAAGFSSTLIGLPGLTLRQAATGLSSTTFGSPASSTGGVAIGWKSDIVFGRPQVGKAGYPTGFSSTAFATPVSHARFIGTATGFSTTVVPSIGAGFAQRSTRGARFRQTWGLGRTERFLPTP